MLVPDVGGGFGSKGTLPVETPLVALAALELGRPVKWAEDRRENFLSAPQGRGLRGAVELALRRRRPDPRAARPDSRRPRRLPAAEHGDPAAHDRDAAQGCYDIPAVEVFVTGARTNKVPTGPYRGAGRPEASYLIETTIDAAARELGIDPVELRRRNLVRAFPYRTALGWTYDSGDFERCLDRAVRADRRASPRRPRARAQRLVGAAARHLAPRRRSRSDVVVGTGVALCVERSGGLFEHARRSTSTATATSWSRSARRRPGRATRRCSRRSPPSGSGVDPERVTVRTGDTDALADGVGSFASRSTAMGGSAVAAAADDLLARRAGGRARFESDQVFASGAYAAVVEVDARDRRGARRRLVAVDDAGRIVNPLLAEGQVVGGAVQGLGACLTEEAGPSRRCSTTAC